MPEPCLHTDTFADPAAYAAQILFEYEEFIRCIIRTQNRTTVSEDDLFQDFYLELIAKPVPENVRSIRSYLYRAVVNHLATSSNRIASYEKKIKNFQKKGNFKVNTFDPSSALLIRDEINKMLEILKKISPGQKYVAITLRFRDGYSMQEVANKMGIKYTSVRRYISNGLGKVRKCLDNT